MSALQAGWLQLGFVFSSFFLLVTGSALQGRPGALPSPAQALRALFIYLFVCSLVPCPELQGEGPARLLGVPSLCLWSRPWPSGTLRAGLALGSPASGASLFYTSVDFLCVYSCGGGRCGCIF